MPTDDELESIANERERVAITLALEDALVSPPHGGKYYRYADAILPLIEEAVTTERDRCARIAGDHRRASLDSDFNLGWDEAAVAVAKAIRADREEGLG